MIKFHKILIKTIQLRERTFLGVTFGQMYIGTEVRTDRGNMYLCHCHGGGIIIGKKHLKFKAEIFY